MKLLKHSESSDAQMKRMRKEGERRDGRGKNPKTTTTANWILLVLTLYSENWQIKRNK